MTAPHTGPRDPILHLLAGPNGSGKSTFVDRVLAPLTHLTFINADVIAKDRWPGAESEHAYEASAAAAEEREVMFSHRASFITETVFSHPSKVQLVHRAVGAGYLVHLHVMLVPVDVTVNRVAERIGRGGHTVPETKIRERYSRLWGLIAEARTVADNADFYDNSNAVQPFRLAASYARGQLIGTPSWPMWAPAALTT